MDASEGLLAIRKEMAAQGIDLLVAFHDGAHFIEKPNAVMALTGFKSIGPTAVVLTPDADVTVIVTPRWDADRAAEAAHVTRSLGADDLTAALADHLSAFHLSVARTAAAGLAGMPWAIAQRAAAVLGGEPRAAEKIVFGSFRCKTAEQIANARMAAEIAERGYRRLLEIARPGLREDELAVELRHSMKRLGADDNFLMLCAGSHNRAVQPSSGRSLEPGDIILAEITPSYKGQMAQICRTAVLGTAADALREGYNLVVRSMEHGIAAAQPGATMADVCRAIDAVLEARGYGEFCHPPHIRRRGHGLGFGSNLPGDVSLENACVLEPGMFFVIHPNQYLPETGYLLCGEPVLVVPGGVELLSHRTASLAEISI
jgi:Xaa-Pro aminopeptidase